MSNLTVKGNVSGTGIVTLESPNTNTNRTITLPDVTGTLLANTSAVIQPRGIPLFSAYQSTAQAIPSNVSTKVNLQTEEVDTAGWFDTTLSRYTPQAAGWYQFIGSVWITTSLTQIIPYIVKSGVTAKSGSYVGTSAGGLGVTGLIYMNGTTDYVELWVQVVTAQNLVASSTSTYFQGYLVRAD